MTASERQGSISAALFLRVSLFLSLVVPSVLCAAPMSADSARRAVSRWTKRCPAAHMRARMDRPVKDVRTVRADGEDAFYVVDLEGGGFVVASADDRIEPIVAFADEGTLVEDPKNPLWALLNLDMPQRVKAHRDGKVRRDPSKWRGRGRHRRWKEPSVEWHELTADDDAQTQTTAQISSVSDVRVDALIQSTWDQSTVGSKTCYNYYTPNGYVCGCVATAGAQLMRFHQFPTASVSPVTKSCWIDDKAADRTMMGGVYDWANMPLKPSYSSLTDVQRQAIGKLCYDVGVSTRMDWTSGGSGACPAVLADSFVSVFGYANAKCELSKPMSTEKTENAIYANLDAGFPVLLGIHASNGGHEIVADGYGVYNDVIYTHLNLGWSGSNNAWYALPSVSAGGYNFTTLSSVVYNVFPDKTGELLTGRVLDVNDNPVAGAMVTAVNGSTTRTATSNANGIYALNVPSGKTWTLTVSATGYVIAQTSESVGTSKSTGLGTISATSYSYDRNGGSVGNSWGNDITLEEATGNALQSIVVNGPASVCKGTKATYVCAARYSDGSLRPVSAKSWSISGNTTTTGWWIFSKTTTHAELKDGVLTASSAKTGISIAATYEIGGKTYSASATMSVVSSSVSPVNDAFAQAVAIGGSAGSQAVDTNNATDESGEPLLKSVPSATGTVWWKWSAPADGVARFDTSGSAVDTVLGVYRGSALTGLTTVAEKGEAESACEFFCTKGEAYYIAVGGWCGTRGSVTLNWQARAAVAVPTADDFTYDGAEHRGVSANEAYALSGTVTAKNAGSYRATAMPKDGYCWPDGSTGPTDIAWSIGKAPLVVTATNATVVVGEDAIFGATCEGFVAGEDEKDLGGPIEFTCAYEPQSAKAGETYAIVPVVDADNYEATCVAGVLTVVADTRLVPGGIVGVDVPANPTQEQIAEAVEKVEIVIADPAAEAAGQKDVVRKRGVYNDKTGQVEVVLEIDETAPSYVGPDEAVAEVAEDLAEVGSGEGKAEVTIAPKNLTKGLYYSIVGAGELGAFGKSGAVEGDRVLADGKAIALPVPKVPGRAAFFRIVQNLTQKGSL